MQRAIRLMVCVALAATSAATFADTRGESEPYDATMQGENELQSMQGQDEPQPIDRFDDGHGSGEPALSSATAASSSSAEEASVDDKAAIREYNRQEFVRENWMPNP